MKILIRNSDNVVIYADDSLTLTATEASGHGWVDRSFNADNARLDYADLPENWTGAVWAYDGEWSIADQAEHDAHVAAITPSIGEQKQVKLTHLAALAKTKLEGGTIINGLRVSTDADAKGLLALGKIGNKASRKIVTSSGQKATLTAAQFDGLVAAVDTFGQAVMDRHYDLIGAIEAAADQAALDAVDIDSGWPN